MLRLLRAHHDPAMVMREQAIQNALADQGYPAARVLHAALDPAPLGAAFLLMERLPGTPLISTRPVGMDRPLLEAQLRLHALDPAPLPGRGRTAAERGKRALLGEPSHVVLDDRGEGLAARLKISGRVGIRIGQGRMHRDDELPPFPPHESGNGHRPSEAPEG